MRLLIGKLQRDGVSSSSVKEVLRDEIRYQKTMLRRKGTLKLAGTVTELTRALELHLPEEEDAQPQVPAPAPDAEQAADVAELEVEAETWTFHLWETIVGCGKSTQYRTSPTPMIA